MLDVFAKARSCTSLHPPLSLFGIIVRARQTETSEGWRREGGGDGVGWGRRSGESRLAALAVVSSSRLQAPDTHTHTCRGSSATWGGCVHQPPAPGCQDRCPGDAADVLDSSDYCVAVLFVGAGVQCLLLLLLWCWWF